MLHGPIQLTAHLDSEKTVFKLLTVHLIEVITFTLFSEELVSSYFLANFIVQKF